MEFKPYEKYKKVALPWIDEIPSHWEMERNKNFLTVKDETVGNKDKNYKLLSLTKKGIIERDMENPKGKFPSSFETYKIVEKNDIIFCLFDIDETPRTVGLSKLDGMITGAYNIFSINKINKNYYYYYYLYLDKFKMLKPLYTGLRKTINEDAFLRLRTPLPPKEEQDKIAAFLDHNLAKIDKFVELTERQIELLKEQKKVLINDAVTKGIDKNVAYKDSGIEWIGKIPEHWEVTRLKYVAHINNGQDYKNIESKDGYPVIGSGGEFAYALKYIYDGESVLFGRKGTINKPLYINGKFWTIDTMFYTKILEKINAKFLYYNAILFPFDFYSTKTALPSMTQYSLQNIMVTLPPFSEQEEIVVYIEKEISKIDRTIELYKNQIELIKEYRTSLIASAVTGKIDVRDF